LKKDDARGWERIGFWFLRTSGEEIKKGRRGPTDLTDRATSTILLGQGFKIEVVSRAALGGPVDPKGKGGHVHLLVWAYRENKNRK